MIRIFPIDLPKRLMEKNDYTTIFLYGDADFMF